MVNKSVRQFVLKKLGCSPSALSQRVKRLKSKYGPMTTDEAVYVIAHQLKGIDLPRFLPLEIIDRVRSLIPKELHTSRAMPVSSSSRARARPSFTTVATYPFVTSQLVRHAITLGGETFPKIYVLENSIRCLIKRTLKQMGPKWWKRCAPSDVQQNVARIIEKEKKYAYRAPRGKEPLAYCNFADLREIILKNWKLFETIIKDKSWFKVKMDEVYMARNCLAHSIELSSQDINRIQVFHRDWATLLENSGIK